MLCIINIKYLSFSELGFHEDQIKPKDHLHLHKDDKGKPSMEVHEGGSISFVGDTSLINSFI